MGFNCLDQIDLSAVRSRWQRAALARPLDNPNWCSAEVVSTEWTKLHDIDTDVDLRAERQQDVLLGLVHL